MDEAALDARFKFGCRLIEEAGALALGYFDRLETLNVKAKGVQDMASEADLNTEILIRDAVRAAFPEDAFLGEETGRSADLEEGQGIWVVDPIDGTQPFVSGMSSWCVSIGFMAQGRIEMGFVFAPARRELFIGRPGHAATLNGRPIRVSTSDKLNNGMLGVGYSPRVPARIMLPLLGSLLGQGGVYYRDGSGALMLCYAACGRLIGYVEPHINSWDCLGALAILEAAGGVANDFLVNDGLWHGNHLAAGPPQLHSALLALFEEGGTLR